MQRDGTGTERKSPAAGAAAGSIGGAPLRTSDAWGLLLLLTAAVAGLHLLHNALTPFGIFRDELYYIACSKRPDFGYVDQPPLSIWMLAAVRAVIGASQFAIRFPAALFSAVTVFFAGAFAIRAGGGKYAVALTVTTVALAPIFLAMHSIYSMNVISHACWAAAFYALLLLAQADGDAARRRAWLLLGAVMGIGLLNKIDMLWFGAGLAAAVLATALRKDLRKPWPWAAAAMAAAGLLPFILWNAAHDWAHLEFMRNATAYKYAGISRFDFLSGQLLMQNPFYLPLWFGGLFLLFSRGRRALRPAGIVFLTVTGILIVNAHSKPEYLAPAFIPVYAAAGLWIESVTRMRRRWLRPAVLSLAVAAGLLVAPMAMPVFAPETFQSYAAMLGVGHPNVESNEIGALPQFYADMHGWEQLARTVAEVYAQLPPEEAAHAVVFARNYGQAGAVEHFTSPPLADRVIAVHNNYWMWGYPDSVGTVIVIGGDEDSHRASCDEVRKAAVFRHRWNMPYENNLAIWICRGLRVPLARIWREEKIFI